MNIKLVFLLSIFASFETGKVGLVYHLQFCEICGTGHERFLVLGKVFRPLVQTLTVRFQNVAHNQLKVVKILFLGILVCGFTGSLNSPSVTYSVVNTHLVGLFVSTNIVKISCKVCDNQNTVRGDPRERFVVKFWCGDEHLNKLVNAIVHKIQCTCHEQDTRSTEPMKRIDALLVMLIRRRELYTEHVALMVSNTLSQLSVRWKRRRGEARYTIILVKLGNGWGWFGEQLLKWCYDLFKSRHDRMGVASGGKDGRKREGRNMCFYYLIKLILCCVNFIKVLGTVTRSQS